MTPTFAAADTADAILPLHLVTPQGVGALRDPLGPVAAAWLEATGFAGKAGQLGLIPEGDGRVAAAVIGLGDIADRRRGRFPGVEAAKRLPAGTWRIAEGPVADTADLSEFALGWLLAQYQYLRYRPGQGSDAPKAALMAPPGVDGARIEAIAAGEWLTRDLINTPAADMGPAELEAAIQGLGARFGAEVTTILGDDLLAQNLPLIHAVGRAATAARAPRLVTLAWGTSGPALTLVGKGVCFDTGGLNLKPGTAMGLMKKDMGGAANVLGLAHMIMALDLPLRLQVLIPAVENAVSAESFRPQDILTARNGLTIEVNNTDAEGRLVLADALTLAAEGAPDLTISMATLTGAARVALGPDLAPFFASDAAFARTLTDAAEKVRDPVWQLPFHDPYETMIEPGIADLDNAPSGGFAGSITAALFLRRFAPDAYIHFDIYGWTPSPAPARPKGGVGQGTRAVLEALPGMLGL